jgi:hypothetical protein
MYSQTSNPLSSGNIDSGTPILDARSAARGSPNDLGDVASSPIASE